MKMISFMMTKQMNNELAPNLWNLAFKTQILCSVTVMTVRSKSMEKRSKTAND